MEERLDQIVAFLEWLIHLAGHYSALTLLGITQAGQIPIVGALANFTTLFGGVVLILQLTRVLKGDSKVLQRIDERVAAIDKR